MTCVAPAFERPPSGKVYTVYDRRDGRVYGLRHERTALVAFRCAQDAFTVSRALERHYTTHGEYPEHNLEDYPRALDALLPAPPSFRRPKFLRMRAWKSAEQLMDTCRWNGLDFLYCTEVITRPHVAYSGELFHTTREETRATGLVGILNRKLVEDQFGDEESERDEAGDAGGLM